MLLFRRIHYFLGILCELVVAGYMYRFWCRQTTIGYMRKYRPYIYIFCLKKYPALYQFTMYSAAILHVSADISAANKCFVSAEISAVYRYFISRDISLSLVENSIEFVVYVSSYCVLGKFVALVRGNIKLFSLKI
jgi:hypothetical protein